MADQCLVLTLFCLFVFGQDADCKRSTLKFSCSFMSCNLCRGDKAAKLRSFSSEGTLGPLEVDAADKQP